MALLCQVKNKAHEGNEMFKLNYDYAFGMEKGTFSEHTLYQANRILRHSDENGYPVSFYQTGPYEHISGSTVENALETYPKMRYSKAIAKYVKKHYDIKLPDALKEKLGNFLTENEPKDILGYMLLTQGIADDSAINYLHSGSCWWGDYGVSRFYLDAIDGGALRMYMIDNDKLFGRVWWVKHEDGLVLFNSYVQNPHSNDGNKNWLALQNVADLAAQALDFENVQKVYLVKGNSPDRFYTNNSYGFYIGPKENINNTYYFPYADVEDEYTCTCEDCGDLIPEDEQYYVIRNGYEQHVCEYCFNNDYYYTETDNHYHHEDDVIECNGHWYLTDDENIVYSQTEGEYYHIDDAVYIESADDYIYCDNAVYVEYMDQHFHEDDTTTDDITDDIILKADVVITIDGLETLAENTVMVGNELYNVNDEGITWGYDMYHEPQLIEDLELYEQDTTENDPSKYDSVLI